MPYCYLYQCPSCSHDVEVVVAREFSESASGAREDYQYPAKDLYVWPVPRVAGLWSQLWCRECREIRPHVLLALAEPTENPAHAFFTAEARGIAGDETGPCPECGAPLTIEVEGELCPRCGQGELALLGEYEP